MIKIRYSSTALVAASRACRAVWRLSVSLRVGVS